MLKEKLMEDLKSAMRNKEEIKKIQFKWSELQFYKLKKIKEYK